MNERFLEYIKKMSNIRELAIWGTGNLSVVAEEILEQLNLCSYVYVDNSPKKQAGLYKGKKVVNPNMINKDYFILISTTFFPEISADLYIKGYKELEDYVSVLEPDFYEALLKNYDAPRVPEMNIDTLNYLERTLRENIECEDIAWFSEAEFVKYERELEFAEAYKKGYDLIWESRPYSRYRRKIMEYYIVDKLLKYDEWDGDDVYLDLGSHISPFAKYLREKRGIKAYGIDLEKSIYADLGYYLQQDVTDLHFADNSVRAMSAQSAYETFTGTTDSKLIQETARVLKPGGKFVILPLYMHEKYLSTVSPTYYGKGTADEGSYECIRTDCRGDLAIGRFYDMAALKRRVLNPAKQFGLKAKIYILPNNLVECDSFVYLKFILVLQKQ